MSRIDDIFKDADAIIEKRASASKTEKTASKVEPSQGLSIAESILKGDYDSVKTASESSSVNMTDFEKIAHAVAIVETMINFNELSKLTKVAQEATSRGFSKSEVDSYIEKKASELPLVSVAEAVGLIEKTSARKGIKSMLTSTTARRAAGLAGAGTLGALAHKKGKESGREEALDDVRKAFQSYNQG